VQLLPPSHPLTKAGAWTKYHLAVTRRKDAEPRSVASRFDTYVPGAPFVSLDDFIDGARHVASVTHR
jgi:Copper amine oxidase, enzyme domain